MRNSEKYLRGGFTAASAEGYGNKPYQLGGKKGSKVDRFVPGKSRFGNQLSFEEVSSVVDGGSEEGGGWAAR